MEQREVLTVHALSVLSCYNIRCRYWVIILTSHAVVYHLNALNQSHFLKILMYIRSNGLLCIYNNDNDVTVIMRMLFDIFSNMIYELTFAPSSLTLSRSPVPRSTMVAMLSNGFLTMCMNFIGTPTFLAISSKCLILLGSLLISNEVRPPFLSPIT